jgi:hypothetical protein
VAVITVGAAAIDAAEQAKRAADLAERASAAMLERTAPPSHAPKPKVEVEPQPAPRFAAVEEDDSLRDFSARADRLAKRLKELQGSEIPPVWGGRSPGSVRDP